MALAGLPGETLALWTHAVAQMCYRELR